MPFFSVIIPTYNRAKYLPKAINSVLTQSFSDLELIIIDDASIDDTSKLVKRFIDPRIIYIKNKSNQERSISRNIGVDNSKGKYICFLDGDDWYGKNHLINFYNQIKIKEFPVSVFFSSAHNVIGNQILKRGYPNISNYNIFNFILIHTFGLPLSCIHRKIFDDFILDKEIPIAEDLDFFLRVATKYQINQIDSFDYYYNLCEDSFTVSDPKKPFKELDSYKKIFKKKILKGKLSFSRKNKLISKCYFFFCIYFDEKKYKIKTYKYLILSILLCPRGYNRKTNKILARIFIYNLPIIGNLFKKIYLQLR